MRKIDPQINEVASWPGVYSFELKLKEGDAVHQITSSLNRYGEFIIVGKSFNEIDTTMKNYSNRINGLIEIQTL